MNAFFLTRKSGSPSKTGWAARRGFSLVEMVLALGIASFSIVPMLGLIVLGLRTSRDAIETTVQAQILQTVRNQIMLGKFDGLKDRWDGRAMYFDDQGLLVSDPNAPSRIFTAIIHIQDGTVAGASMASGDMQIVVVTLSNRTTPQTSATCTLVVANSGS